MSGTGDLVYIVQREGVYGGGLVGVFTTAEKALEAALVAAGEETDGWHEFSCYELQSNLRVRIDFNPGHHDQFVFRIKREQQLGTDGYKAVIVQGPGKPVIATFDTLHLFTAYFRIPEDRLMRIEAARRGDTLILITDHVKPEVGQEFIVPPKTFEASRK